MPDTSALLESYRKKMIAFESLVGMDAMTYIDAMVAMKTAADKCRDAGVSEYELREIRRRFLMHALFMTDES